MLEDESTKLDDFTLRRLKNNDWKITSYFYGYDSELDTNTLGYQITSEYMLYRLESVEDGIYDGSLSYKFRLDKLVDLVETHKINIINLDTVADDIQIFKERHSADIEQQFQEYEKYRLKCELLGIQCTDIRKEDLGYVLYELIPDENGVATVPDFVTKLCRGFSDKNKKYTYKKVIWKHPLVLSIDSFFHDNKNIVKLDLTEFNLSRIPSMQCMFNTCVNLEEVDFGNNDFHNVIDMRLFFHGCRNLTKAELSKASFNRYVDLDRFGSGTPKLKVLNMCKAKAYTKPVNLHGKYKVGQYLIDEYSGEIARTSYVMIGSTSLAHITSWLSTSKGDWQRNKLVFVDELTGINFLKDFITEEEDREKRNSLWEWGQLTREKETCDSPKDMYKQVLNKNIIVRLIPDDSTESNAEFGRVGVLGSIGDKLVSSTLARKFKYRLLIESYYDSRNLIEIFFNSYTE